MSTIPITSSLLLANCMTTAQALLPEGFSKSRSQDLMAGKKPTGFSKGRLLQAAEQAIRQTIRVLFLYSASEIIKRLLFSWLRSVSPKMNVKVKAWCDAFSCLRQSPCQVWWWQLQQFSRNRLRGIATQTHRHKNTHRLGVVYLKLFQSKTLTTKRSAVKVRLWQQKQKEMQSK